MRASRLLQILLLLQNRGRMSCASLAAEVEVTRRTILRDVDAMTEAGLPVIVFRGNGGGVELGFNYRTRLTGLAEDEAEALGVILSGGAAQLQALGMDLAGARAVRKLIESFPDTVRRHIAASQSRFGIMKAPIAATDQRLLPLANAVRKTKIVTIQARSAAPKVIHPAALVLGPDGWQIADARCPEVLIPLDECGDINISARSFALPAGR